jgi:tRNA-dependent cyclodipeptide synthase
MMTQVPPEGALEPVGQPGIRRAHLARSSQQISGQVKDLMLLTSTLSLMDDNRVKYRLCHFSPAQTQEDVEQEVSRLGMGLLEAVPLDVEGEGLILAVIPASLAVNYVDFCERLAPSTVRPLASDEIPRRLAPAQSAHIPPFARLFGAKTLLSPLIEQVNTVGFFVDTARTLITLAASDFRRLVGDCPRLPVPTRTKYRAYASVGRNHSEHCILGVSLENPIFHTAKLITITDWIRNHYTHCAVMLGDGLHRITLQLDTKLSEREALEHSRWLARDFVQSQSSVFNMHNPRFDFIFCSDIQQTQRYREYRTALDSLFQDAPEFRQSFFAFSRAFLERRPQRQAAEHHHVEMSCRYLLEELAILCCLSQDYPWTFVYPGSLTILEEIAQGKHTGVPAGLLQMEYVELKLKRR